MLEIPVELGARRYVISVGHGLARQLPDLLATLRGRRTVVVASRRVFASHGRSLARSLRGLGEVHTCLVPDGERYKSPSMVIAISPRDAAASGKQVQFGPSRELRGHRPAAVNAP